MIFAPHIRLAFLLLLGMAIAPVNATPARAAQRHHLLEETCDSARSGTQAETLSCYTAAAAKARSEVQRALRENLRVASSLDRDTSRWDRGTDSSSAERLKSSQSAWLKYVDAQCSYEGQSSAGGSGEDILRARCLYRANRMRAAELKAARQLYAR